MADLAIGISKSAVLELVKRVKNAKKEEAKQWQIVESDIVFMKHEFEMMQSFLASVAADGETFRGDVARTWVRQVRDLSDGAEDCIDFVLHLDTERSFLTFCVRVLPSCMTGGAVLPLDRAVSDIKQLKATVQDVSNRNMRYSLGLSKVVPVAGDMQLASSSAAKLNSFEASDAALNKAAVDCLMAEMAVDYDAHLSIFSICGTGGDFGTISIAWNVYEHPAFCSEFPLRAWVKLTQPFNPSRFILSLAEQFEVNNSRRNQGITNTEEQLVPNFAGDIQFKKKFVEYLSKIKYLIVLEGVFSMAEWEAARAFLPDGNTGSRVILLTHHEQLEIAKVCTGQPYQGSLLREFTPHHSVYVFYQNKEHTRATDPTREPRDSEHKDMATVVIPEEHGSGSGGELLAKPSAVISVAQSSGKHKAMPTVVEITEAQASGDRLRSHCSGGFDSQVKKLDELIGSQVQKHHLISVCGISRAAKSVVRTSYCNYVELERNCAWVMAPNPFDIKEFCRRLHWIMMCQQPENSNIVSECRLELYLYWYLIVIDGLQSEADWHSIKKELDLGKYRNCIIVVTNDEHVARDCAADQGDVFNISDQGDLHLPLQCQFDDETFIKPARSSKLSDAYRWLCSDKSLMGRDSSEEKKLEELITSRDRRDKHHVISVCGNTGAGKTFIVRTMYFRCIQREMLEDLFGEYVWVDVPHPFDIMEFCQRLYNAWTPISVMDLDFVQKCSELMNQKRRFLLVIDGLQSTNDWDSILQAGLPLATCISCIIVVTRYQTVARHCATTEDEICRITSLQEDATRRFIRDQIVQQQGDVPGTSEQDPNLTEEAFVFTNKCGRFPEVVNALRTYLESKQKGGATKIAALRRLNVNFMQELKANRDLEMLLRVFTSMHSSIHACPQVIKKCIFYLSIFDQGRSIRRDRLVRRWIAEGYSEGIDSISMAVYTETNLFHKLDELGMITKPAAAQSSTSAAVNSSGTMRMSSCQVNSLFLDYITTREKEESIFLPLEVTVLDGGRSPPKTQHVGQHLAIRNWEGEKAVFDCLDLTRLRSLTVSGQWQPFFVSDMMLVLRVLDLEGTTRNLRDGDLKQIVEQLPRLKFLSLRGCIEITRLPRSIGGLRQLQALDVRGTSIRKLPGSIVKLHKLQFLRAGAATGDGQRGVRVPRGIGALKALHTLGAIDVSSSCTRVAILNGIHGLQQLRKLHVSGIIKKRHNSLCACVACFVSGCQASSLRFPTNSFGEIKVLEIACSPSIHVQFAEGAVPKLEKVKLYCHDGCSLQFSGLEFLRSSLKQIVLKGPGCIAVEDSVRKELNLQIPNNQIALKIVQTNGSQPESVPAHSGGA